MKRFSLRLEDELHEKLRVESFQTGVSINKIIVEAVEQKYNKEEMGEMLKEKLERLEELKGKEMTLLEMDNKVQEILDTESSIFDGETEVWIEDREFAYTAWKDEPLSEIVDINIHFTILEESENNLETVVKINDIEEL